MKTITLQLETLSCPSCIRKIESALSSLNGVKEVRVQFNASKIKALIESEQSSAELLVETVENLGFKVLSHK